MTSVKSKKALFKLGSYSVEKSGIQLKQPLGQTTLQNHSTCHYLLQSYTLLSKKGG